MTKIDSATIDKIIAAYDQLKSYAAVARELGISAATVSKYVKNSAAKPCAAEKIFVAIDVPPIIETSLIGFSELTAEQESSYERMWNEL